MPEKPNEPIVDEYLENAAAQYFISSSLDESSSATPIMSVSHSGSLSGRCSTYSWGADEGVSVCVCVCLCLSGSYFQLFNELECVCLCVCPSAVLEGVQKPFGSQLLMKPPINSFFCAA